MAIELQPVPPIRDLSKPQDVRRLMEHLNAIQVQIGRISDNADAPDTPTAIAVRQGAGKTVEIVATFAEPPFPWTAELWRNTANDVTTATKIDTKAAHGFHDVNVTYASTYYYWVRTVGLNGTNYSGWSPSSSHSITVSRVVTNDIGQSQVTQGELADLIIATSKIIGQAVTTDKRQYYSTVSQSVSVPANDAGTYTFTHNLGVKAAFAVRLTGSWPGTSAATQYDNTNTTLGINIWNGHPSMAISGTFYVDYW